MESLYDSQSDAPDAINSRRWATIGLLIGGLVLLGLAFLFGFSRGQEALPGKDRLILQEQNTIAAFSLETTQLKRELTNALSKPCLTDTGDTNRINALIARGDYSEAAVIAELVLTSGKKLCGQALADAWLTASLDSLESTPIRSPLDQAPILSYQSIERKALRFGAPMPSPMAVFSQSYASGDFQLAQYAFVQAFKQGLVSVDDVGALNEQALGVSLRWRRPTDRDSITRDVR
jgi:hypothetical protein